MNIKQNIPEYGVSEFNFLVKDTLESNFDYIKIRGEISQINKGRIGQIFVTLKDEDSIINGVIWKNKKTYIKIDPEIGMEVIATGKITTYAKSISMYQIDIDDLEVAGEGSLLKIIEQRKQKLSAEGIFDEKYKKAIPYLPKKIGIITSPTGSVIHDIINRIKERFPINIDLWPTAVQGKEAAEMIINAIKGFNNDKYLEKPDTIIIARGGGSVEDLMIFNDENLAKAVFKSKIPIISAIGHETDNTIIDFVSDKRAPTPTAAAEISVPVREELIKIVKKLDNRLFSIIDKKIQINKERTVNFIRLLKNPSEIIKYNNEKLHYISNELENKFLIFFRKARNDYQSFYQKMKIPTDLYKLKRLKFENIFQNLHTQFDLQYEKKINSLLNSFRILKSNSVKNNLKKGYSIVRKNKKIINNSKEIKVNDIIEIEFFDDKKYAKTIKS